VIVEERTYHIHTGKLPEIVKLYETEGVPLQQELLGHLVGWFTVDVGDLSSIVAMWAYEDYGDRERRRAAMAADPRWQTFAAKIQPLIHTQRNRILIPTAFSPVR
jgi:hypothetical protein